MTEVRTHRTVEAVWRMESARIIGGLIRMTGDVGLAEDMAQEALVAALEQWPAEGVPEKPGAWLTMTAKHRAIDAIRRKGRLQDKYQELLHETPTETWDEVNLDALDSQIDDDVLRLIFTACHPVLSRDASVAVTLRLLGGLSNEEIGRAFFLSASTVAQRIVRAKRTLSEARVPFEVPIAGELEARLATVLEVIYLIFNEGYVASRGREWLRSDLCEEALRLGRILAELMPREPEVHGLVALMEIQASRSAARVGPGGEPILLMEQNRSRWDQLLIRRGLSALERAMSTGESLGPYALQGAIAACHARARTPDDTDWEQIVALYDALAQVIPSPVVELNRCVAVSMAYGPAAALEIVDELAKVPSLHAYHLLPSVRGDLLAKLDRRDEAQVELLRAADLTSNERERDLLRRRAEQLRRST